MARLTVKLNGEEVASVNLERGSEYIAGRGADAQIRLSSERGISRHHLKFFESDGTWICESLSKFALAYMNGEPHQVIELSEDSVFTAPPYEFLFELNPTATARSESAVTESRSRSAEVALREQADDLSAVTASGYTHEATVASAAANLIPYIRISFPNSADDEVLKLEGHLWVAGRDPNCEIAIDSPHVSRKHFELARTQEGFYLTDLGSSNGTKVNGQRQIPHEPKRLESGDEISVKTVAMVFEIRDANFNNRVNKLPAISPYQTGPEMPVMSPAWNGAVGSEDPTVLQLQASAQTGMPPLKDLRLHHLQDPAIRKRVIRLGLMALIPLLIVISLFQSDDKPAPQDQATRGAPGFEKLSPEQKSLIKDSFNLARNLYVQGKYELCLAELAKVHELTPLFENSKELESFCAQGKELVIRQNDLERKKREQEAIENQIAGYIEVCKRKLTNQSSLEETRHCLNDAMVLSPEHPTILAMLQSAQANEDERHLLAQQREADKRQTARANAHYKKARALYKEGQLAKSLVEYESFLDAPYAKAEDIKSSARRDIASIKAELKKKIDVLVDACNALSKKNQLKEAYAACDKALKEDPSNTSAKETRKRMIAELRKEMKSIYEDSVLEESLGNVDSAKEKWKKIVTDDLDIGEYFLKAKSKLQKYGAE